MSPIRAFVVDDEQLAREELCFLLGQAGDVEVTGSRVSRRANARVDRV
jgi:hypothetical protein